MIDQNAMGNEKPIPIVTQHNQYDIDFLFQRARMRGYVVFIQEEDKVDRPASASSTSARRRRA